MPVSELSWSLPSQPCFQLYGTKRKNTDKEEQMTVQEPLVVPFAKRMCFLPVAQDQQNHLHVKKNEFLLLENPTNLEQNGSNIQQVNTVMQQTQFTDTESNDNFVEMMDSDVAMEETSSNREQNFQHIGACQQQQLKSQELGRQQRELLIKRTEKLEQQLKFIKEQGIESNDYWAAPSDTQLTMQDELEQARIQMESDFAPDPYQYSYPSGPGTLPLMGYDVRSKVRCYCKPTWEGVMNQNCFI